MLIEVLTRFCSDSGIDPVQQRALGIQYLNNAAKEIYNQLECNKIYREISLLVPANKVVSLPGFVGSLRGMRMHTTEMQFDLHGMMQPRYVQSTLTYRFKNWRDLGESSIKIDLESVAPLTLEAVTADNVDVLISGQTDKAERIEETITMDSSPKTTTNNFGPIIWKIACLNSARTCNISIKDDAGNEIAVLYNNQTQTRYRLVDVSELFWSLDTSNSDSIIDVLYKEPLARLSKDTDSFPASDDYDEAWYFMAMHLYYKPQQGRQQDSDAFRGQAQAALVSVKGTTEDNMVKKISFGRNKFYSLMRNSRFWPGSVTNVDRQ